MQGGDEDVDRDQLAALLQALAAEPAVPRKTARAVRCGILTILAGSSNLTLLPPLATAAVRFTLWL